MRGSRLLNSLSSQAQSTKDPIVWAKAICRAASHFARHGRTQEALTSIEVVRRQFNNELPFEIASWLMLAEGVLHYFQVKTKESYDRLQRAYGLAIALKNDSALPTCAAWMAHLEFDKCAYEKMASHLDEAFTRSTENDHQAKARASLVLACAYHLAGSYTLARPWYESARLHAAVEGDDATLSAMLFNVAALRASNVRLDDTFGIESNSEIHRAGMEASSAENYDDAIGSASLDFLSLMLRGQLLTISKKYLEALRYFEAIDLSKLRDRMIPTIEVDRAWCMVNLGRMQDASREISRIELMTVSISEADDLAYIRSRLSQISYACGDLAAAARFRASAEIALSDHRNFQKSLLKIIEKIKTK